MIVGFRIKLSLGIVGGAIALAVLAGSAPARTPRAARSTALRGIKSALAKGWIDRRARRITASSSTELRVWLGVFLRSGGFLWKTT